MNIIVGLWQLLISIKEQKYVFETEFTFECLLSIGILYVILDTFSIVSIFTVK